MQSAVALLVFAALSLLHTYPLVTGLDRLSRHNDDEWLNAWTVSWIAHQLPRAPWALFDANMFYPHEDTLAYTEPLVVPAVLGLPVHWVGGSPLLTYNVVLLVGLTLTAWATCHVVVRWTGDWWGGVLGGAAMAFSAPMLTRLPHLQAMHFYWLPLAVGALDRFLERRRPGPAMALAACVLGAALTSGYTAVFVTLALGAAMVARAPSWWGRRGADLWRFLIPTALATLGAGVVLLWPYLRLQQPRPLPVSSDLWSTLQMYLSTAADFHYGTWGRAVYERAPATFFPGATAIALAGLAWCWRGRGGVADPRGMLIGVALVGLVMSLGTLTPIYGWFYHLIPTMQTLRAPDRFGILVFFAVATLAGVGLATLRRRLRRRWRLVVSLAAVALVTGESLHAPIPYRPLEWRAPIYRTLAAMEPGPIVELPLHAEGQFHRNAIYLLASTSHWQPLVNGFGNSRPATYDAVAAIVETFPSVPAVALLSGIGVRHVVVHAGWLPTLRGRTASLIGRSDLVLVAQQGADRIYRVNDPPPGSGLALLSGLPWLSLAAVDPMGDGSYLRSSLYVGDVYALQGDGRFVAYLEHVTDGGRLLLRVPAPMAGRFVDADTGRTLGDVRVAPRRFSESAARVDVPAGRVVILDLQAEVP